VKESVRGKGDPPVESPGSDWTHLLSKLILREEEVQLDPEPALDHNGLGLTDIFSSS